MSQNSNMQSKNTLHILFFSFKLSIWFPFFRSTMAMLLFSIFHSGCSKLIWLKRTVYVCEIILLRFHCVPCLCIAIVTSAMWLLFSCGTLRLLYGPLFSIFLAFNSNNRIYCTILVSVPLCKITQGDL